MDPKEAWALANRELFSVEINKADYHLLLRVPGIGKRSAEEIISRRKAKRLSSLEDLKAIRNLKKILKYITDRWALL
jgi:predicted DNA-binding helix-hairpin-helix protein